MDVHEPETQGHIGAESVVPSSEGVPEEAPCEGEISRDAPVPGLSRNVPDITPRFRSGPGKLEYDDAERERHEPFGEIRRQLADGTKDAAEAEMRREHEFQEKEAERDRQFAERQAERDRRFEENEARREELLSRLARQPVPPIRDIGQGEREDMARQPQEEREQARAARDALEQQLLAERKRGDDERDARMGELEKELARVRAELVQERQKHDHDEEMRREAGSCGNLERDKEMGQQPRAITDLLLAHREEFLRKNETVDERWRETLEWRDETNRQFKGLFNMVQDVLDCREEEKARYEEERRDAAERPCKRRSLVHHVRVPTILQLLKMS